MEARVRAGWCWTFRDGTVTRLLAANEVKDALKAAGLCPRSDGSASVHLPVL
jgi:hypothetical protein